MAELAALKVVVTGMVQGVSFRDFTRRKALELNLNGFVRNLPGGKAVELEGEGERSALEALLEDVKRGPPRARVDGASPTWAAYSGKYTEFRIK